ncbi:MotA/TolQ/ExbB proton channel family protein [Marichromatium sp. AB32]|uniref:MotA/TolQ/ExbB proton channel family protein n=1 Tax=Marichromatium sp. AB32 TaxID=2483363 RepID=UPI000F41478B|nr:MotA/TolQ/ExbB proton channel family protein [Marichromatium sp. AB32]
MTPPATTATEQPTPITEAPDASLESAATTPAPDIEPTAAADAATAVDPTALVDPSPWAGLIGVAQERLSVFTEVGGPVLASLAVLSVVAAAIILVKLWQFARLRIDARAPVDEALLLWHQRDVHGALRKLEERPQPVSRVVHLALVGLRHPKLDLTLLREEIARVASLQLEQLRSHLRALEIIAALSPLLGLLGTVLGMIEAFRQLEQAGAQVDPSILSGGIWQALLTTAAGLTLAIPVVIAHSWLERRVERCGHRMEDAVTRVFTRDLAGAEDEAAIPEQTAARAPVDPAPETGAAALITPRVEYAS